MKVKNIKIFSIVLLIFIFNLIAPNMSVNATKNDSKYDLTVSYGIDGKYKTQKYMPVNVQIKNLEADFNGEVEIRVPSDNSGGYDAYSKEVRASVGENINITIPVKFLEGNSRGTICLIENGKVVYEKKLIITSGRISEGNAFVGLLTDDATALGYLGNITYMDSKNSNTGKMNCVNLTESLLNENGLNIDGLDVIIINNYNMANLNEKQYNSLNNWVSSGGTLLIGAGANETKTINNINKNFLNISSTGTVEKNVLVSSENLNLMLSQINFDGAVAINSSNENNLIYSLNRGEGKILVTSFDLGLEPFISSKDSSIILQNMLKETFDKIYEQNNNGGYSHERYEASHILNSIPVNSIVSTLSLGLILAIYAILVGIVLYIVLKKMKRRDLTWILIPVTAVIFTVLIYLLGSKMKLKDVVLNSVNIISTDKKGRGEVNGYIGITSKNKGNIRIEKDEDLKMNYMTEDYYYYSDGEPKINNLKVKTTYNDDNSYFTVSNSNVSQINKFEVSGKEIVVPKIENSLKFKNGNLEGTIKNNLDSDIKKLIIVSGEGVWDLGEVSTGKEISINDLKCSSTLGIQGYANYIQDEYYQSRWNKDVDSKDPKFKNIQRYSSLLNLLEGKNYVGDKTKIIAITEMPVDYSLKLESKSISNYNLTAIVQEANIDFKDENGNLNFPEGYFKYTVSELGNKVNYDYYEGYIYGEGEIVLDYKVDDNIEIKEITINCNTDRWGNDLGLNGEYYIYNYNTKQYEKFSLDKKQYKLINDGSYTLNNTIKIKAIVNEKNGEVSAPKLIIQGVEK